MGGYRVSLQAQDGLSGPDAEVNGSGPAQHRDGVADLLPFLAGEASRSVLSGLPMVQVSRRRPLSAVVGQAPARRRD